MVNVESCLDPARLARRGMPHSDPTTRAALGELTNAIREADRLIDEERYEEAHALNVELLAKAESIGVPSAIATRRLRVGESAMTLGRYGESVALMRRAYFELASAGAWGGAVEAAQQLGIVLGIYLHEPEAGLRWTRHGEVVSTRLPPSDGVREASLWNTTGQIHSVAGRFDLAVTFMERARATYVTHLGPQHPHVAQIDAALALAFDGLGSFERAGQAHRDAVASHEAAFGPDHPATATILLSLGWFQHHHDEYDAAYSTLTRATRIHSGTMADDVRSAFDSSLLARVQLRRGDVDAAADLIEDARSIVERAAGSRDYWIAAVSSTRGCVHLARGEVAEALAAHRRALSIFDAMYGADHPEVDVARSELGDALVADGRAREAVAQLELAVAGLEKTGYRYELAHARFALARAVAAAGDRPRAREIAGQAADEFERLAAPIRHAEARAWLVGVQ
jgi:tetratricopeptide (TPR) repeat protein